MHETHFGAYSNNSYVGSCTIHNPSIHELCVPRTLAICVASIVSMELTESYFDIVFEIIVC
jgi:hypothetical protein